MVQASLNLGWAILNAAGLSFIGLGVRPPTPEWGIMVAEGAAFIVSGEWWIALFPGRGAHARGVLLQPAGRRAARPDRPAEAHVSQPPPAALGRGPLRRVPHARAASCGRSRASASTSDRARPSGVVGESGSGKSVTALALLGILDPAARVTGGRARVRRPRPADGRARPSSSGSAGREISMIFQNPRTALNPIRPVGQQIADVLLRHAGVPRAEVRKRAVEHARAGGRSPTRSAATPRTPSSSRAACASA